MLSRQAPPAEIVAAAEADYRAIRVDLATLVPVVQSLLAGHFSEIETVTDVWLTLRLQEPRRALFLGAAAIVRLAKNGGLADRRRSRVRRSRRRVWVGGGDGGA